MYIDFYLTDYDSEDDAQYSNQTEDPKLQIIVRKEDPEPRRLQQVFHCTTCSRQFSNLAGLTSHLKSHEEKQFTCNLCEKQFYITLLQINTRIPHTFWISTHSQLYSF